MQDGGVLAVRMLSGGSVGSVLTVVGGGGVLLQIEDDAYQEDLGFSLGQLGKSGSGRVRQAQVNDATKARISKSLQVNPSPPFSPPPSSYRQYFRDPGSSCLTRQRTLQKQSMTYGGKSTVRDRSSGTSSSVAFTPLQVKEEVLSLIPPEGCW